LKADFLKTEQILAAAGFEPLTFTAAVFPFNDADPVQPVNVLRVRARIHVGATRPLARGSPKTWSGV